MAGRARLAVLAARIGAAGAMVKGRTAGRFAHVRAYTTYCLSTRPSCLEAPYPGRGPIEHDDGWRPPRRRLERTRFSDKDSVHAGRGSNLAVAAACIDAILAYMRFVMPVRGGSPSHGNVPKHKGAQRQSRGERGEARLPSTAHGRAAGVRRRSAEAKGCALAAGRSGGEWDGRVYLRQRPTREQSTRRLWGRGWTWPSEGRHHGWKRGEGRTWQ
ncbi:hypothetical protein IQ07DRAFT_594732 [Pyrenochaeta sp. DS3sAY3a]|nr:hypothetical protein IQ07DRAFT_594732 [Pyrenochaeta sp. DS3sAY3a]